jgi:hypothetical protein
MTTLYDTCIGAHNLKQDELNTCEDAHNECQDELDACQTSYLASVSASANREIEVNVQVDNAITVEAAEASAGGSGSGSGSGAEDGIEGCWISSYGRGVGRVMSGCPAGRQRYIALCYPNCPSTHPDIKDLGCYARCPSGMTDDGLKCITNG